MKQESTVAIQKVQNQPLIAFGNSLIEFLMKGVQKVVVRIDKFTEKDMHTLKA